MSAVTKIRDLVGREWPRVALGEITAPIKKQDPKRQRNQKSFRYVDISSVDKDVKQIADVPTVASQDAPSRARQVLQAQDVIVSTVRPNLNGVAMVPGELTGSIGSTGFSVLRAKQNALLPSYLFQVTKTPGFVEYLVRNSTGANYPAVTDKVVRSFEIPLPPLEEQRLIAAILDKADAIRRKYDQALAHSNAFLRSVFLEMFGDTLNNSAQLPMAPLGDHLDFLTSGSRGWAKYYVSEGSSFIRIQNVRSDAFDENDLAHVIPPNTAEANRTRVQPGDVLLSITADLGRVAVVPDDIGDAYINQHLALLRTSSIEPEFLASALSSRGPQHEFKRLDRSGVKSGLNFDDIRSVPIAVPPRSQQQDWVRIKQAVRKTKKRLTENEKYCVNLANALSQNLLH
ncbi:restriction endonuclease subunit S [Nisaea sediminum]|uniref:restriction endonuclease subunit S n=1 Tax=Nisaea sediminum TaxID=2775867 RepID=UPI00186956D1|nr:restriction endonuclease subunit S [Nisaea sediminum]